MSMKLSEIFLEKDGMKTFLLGVIIYSVVLVFLSVGSKQGWVTVQPPKSQFKNKTNINIKKPQTIKPKEKPQTIKPTKKSTDIRPYIKPEPIYKYQHIIGVDIIPLDNTPLWTKVREQDGVLVTKVFVGGPADRAGLRVDDVILLVDNQRFYLNKSMFESLIEGKRKVKLKIWRNKERKSLNVDIR